MFFTKNSPANKDWLTSLVFTREGSLVYPGIERLQTA